MTFTSGSRLGPYEIVSRIGAGGMGEVFKARDTRLDRSVAIKVLPSEFTSNSELKLRLEREAQMISQLNHPHICTLYDVGQHDGVSYLVMELIEGESLADRVAKGPLPLEPLLRYGAEIADALDVAHRAGVVHRDLKPGNIMITKSGAKLLDFGLAKTGAALQVDVVGATQHKPLTREGTIVGTFQYMAPEQLEGIEADARTDIFALGAVLYEMATGKRAFDGKTRTSLIASIVSGQPRPLREIQPLTPPAFEHVVDKCLEKEPDNRWQSAHDIAGELRWIGENRSKISIAPARRAMPWALALFSLALAAVLTTLLWNAPRQQRVRGGMRFSIVQPVEAENMLESAISPDGRSVAFTAHTKTGERRLWIRPFSSNDATPLPGIDEAAFPFWSPDSRTIGFFGGQKLHRIDLGGAAPQVICDAAPGWGGGTWNSDGVIVFSSGGVLRSVAAAGGAPAQITTIDPAGPGSRHAWPSFLPDGRHFLYLQDAERVEDHLLRIGTLGSKSSTTLEAGVVSNAIFASGYLLYVRNGSLIARRFAPDRLKLGGETTPLAQGFTSKTGHRFDFSAATNGVLAYRTGTTDVDLMWVDRSGHVISSIPLGRNVVGSTLSPDERRVMIETFDQDRRIGALSLLDLASGVRSRFTFDPPPTWNSNPIWSPDGRDVIWLNTTLESPDSWKLIRTLYRKPADGGRSAEVVLRSQDSVAPASWSPDGSFLLLTVPPVVPGPGSNPTQPQSGVVRLSLSPRPILHSLIAERSWESQAQLSPDGRWLAYVSHEYGLSEVFVQPNPPNGTKWQISNGNAAYPQWSRDGRQLFFLQGARRLHAVDVVTDPTFSFGTPQLLFDHRVSTRSPGSGRQAFAPSLDGKRFLLNAARIDSVPITVVLNWTDDLEKR